MRIRLAAPAVALVLAGAIWSGAPAAQAQIVSGPPVCLAQVEAPSTPANSDNAPIAPKHKVPWTNRYPTIFWVAIAAVGLTLAVLIVKQARSLKATEGKRDSERRPE